VFALAKFFPTFHSPIRTEQRGACPSIAVARLVLILHPQVWSLGTLRLRIRGAMFDQRLRVIKEALLAPVARPIASRVGPNALSAGGLACSLVAAVAAWRSFVVVSVICWLAGRFLDGLDGIVARMRSSASDRGAYLDIVLDTIGYAAVPLGVAASVNRVPAWMATAFLLASFYVNETVVLFSVMLAFPTAAPVVFGAVAAAVTATAAQRVVWAGRMLR
jgi:CDP-alcohol phosphatidyltransferase